MPDRNDPIVSTLDSLRADVDQAPLAGAGAARRRGDQRTQRQAIGGGLLAAVLVIGGAGVVLANSDDSHTSLPPAHDQSTAPVTPSPTAAPRSSALTTSVLLTPSELPVDQGVEEPWQALDPTEITVEQLTDRCLPAYDGAQFEQTLQARYTAPKRPTSGQAGVQWVYRAKSEQGARSVYADALAWIQGCPTRPDPRAAKQPQLLAEVDWSIGAAQLHHWELALDAPGRSDVGAVQEVALGQVGSTVSVLVLQDYKQDGGQPDLTKPVAEQMMTRLADAQGL